MLCVGRRPWQQRTRPFLQLLTRAYQKEPPPCLIDVSKRPDGWKDSNATVYHHFIDKPLSNALITALEQAFKVKRFAKGHWDAVIVKYREFTILEDDPGLFLPFRTTVFDPIRTLILEKHLAHRGADDVQWLPPHAIDLHREGGILAHVDSTRFSGEVVCGLSLKSTCIMRLRPAGEDGKPDPQQLDKYVDLLLEPRSLYVLHGDGRYKYTHEIMVTNSVFNIYGDKPRLVSRDPRLSIIFRDDQ